MKIILVFIFSILFINPMIAQNFASQQKKYQRVKSAYTEKEKTVKKYFDENKLNYNNFEVYIRIFKSEKIVEVWAKNKGSEKYSNIVNYNICSTSGTVGPKLQQGDSQTPEGFYTIERFNPFSNFYLSLGINFPNKADKIVTKGKNAGGDIFIHGNCVTIGCIPITDDKIKELYIIATEAKSHGQSNIPVHIFPCKFTEDNFLTLVNNNNNNYKTFWQSLKPMYDYFENNKKIAKYKVDAFGKYSVITN